MAEFVYDFLNVLIFVARLSQCIKHECALAVGSISLCYFLGKLREKIAESVSYVISDWDVQGDLGHFQNTVYSFSFHSGCVAIGDQKGKFLFFCCLYVSEYAARWELWN